MEATNKNQLLEIIKQDASEVCATFGLMFKQSEESQQDPSYFHWPVSLFAAPFPLELFEEICTLQFPLCRLITELIRDPAELIYPALSTIRKTDKFIDRLIKVSESYHAQLESGKPTQTVQMCLLRNDYMIHWPKVEDEPAIKMVEYNTISIGGRAPTALTSNLQQYVARKYHDELMFTYGNDGDQSFFALPRLAGNLFLESGQTQIDAMVQTFVTGLDHYRRTVPGTERPWMLVVIEDIDRWTQDYKVFELELMQKHSYFSMRATFPEIAREGTVDPATNVLRFRGKEIGLVYFRAGFDGSQYITTKAEDVAAGIDFWQVREMVELSMSIKLPSIDY